MFKLCVFFAILAIAFAAPNPKPGLPYSAPFVAAAPAYSYAAPVVSAPVVSYAAPAYSGYVAPSVYGGYSPYVW